MVRKNKNIENAEEKKLKFSKIANEIESVEADDFLKTNFLPYAWSYNLDRALVDETGLKPVQRRILYTMYKNGLSPSSHRMKVASLGGAVLGYHPHGDASVVEALKNLAREHVFRIPLIDGKGDFGMPGKPGAAGRYIEARLSKAGWINVEELSENAVKMVPSYDGSKTEPLKIPVKWPISVINGGSGIAIAYASNMPSHNPTEIMKVCISLVKNKNMTHKQLEKTILGPDFNMGGLIIGEDGIKDYLETGSGTFKIRGQYEVIPQPRGKYRIEFYEIPFGTFPEKILQEVQKHSEKGKFKDISVCKDLSDSNNPIRIIFDTKSGVNYKTVIQEIFKYTSLEINFAANMTTIVNGQPKQCSMKDLLLSFINFRRKCVRNKLNFTKDKKDKRLHIIDGLFKVLLDIDKAIYIIRHSETSLSASNKLKKEFKIDDIQAENILSLQLRRLTKMDNVELKREQSSLEKELKEINDILTNENSMNNYLIKEFTETLKIIKDDRKTVISNVSAEELKEAEKQENKNFKEESNNFSGYVSLMNTGKIYKGSEQFSYSNRVKNYKNGLISNTLYMNNEEYIVVITSSGMGHRIPLSYIHDNKISSINDIGIKLKPKEKIIGFSKNSGDKGVLIGTKLGEVKVSKTDYPTTKDEFPVISLSAGDEIVSAHWIDKNDKNTYCVFISNNGNVLLTEEEAIRASGSKSGAVKGMKLKEKDYIVSFSYVKDISKTFILSSTGKTVKYTPLSEIMPKGRGSQGVALQKFRKGETSVDKAFVGEQIGFELYDNHEILKLPILSKRGASGTPFDLKCNFGII